MSHTSSFSLKLKHAIQLQTQRGWLSLMVALVVALVVLSPIVTLFIWSFSADFSHWLHLLNYVIPNVALNTLLLLVGVGIVVTLLGTGSAYLMTFYHFPTKKILNWALLLPLAVPTYIIAFTYLDLLHPLGPIQSLLRDILGYDSPRQFQLPTIRSYPLISAIFLLGFVLYPYVYLSTRAMLITQSSNLIEAARSLGTSNVGVIFRVVLPLSRPAIIVGLSLALLETLNDIGASEFLGVQTLTTSIYSTWASRSNFAGAAQIALSMLLIVVFIITLEKRARRSSRYTTSSRSKTIQPKRVNKTKGIVIAALCWTPVSLGFILPSSYLLHESIRRWFSEEGLSDKLFNSALNTYFISFTAVLVTVFLGLCVAWTARRLSDSKNAFIPQLLKNIACLGYAIPATVLAIGLLTPFGWTDKILYSMSLGNQVMLGSVIGITVAYVIRFMAISTGSFEAGLARISPSLEQSSRLLGMHSWQTLYRVHIPLLKPSMITAALLIFVDAMKELPATLLLRPVNFETLATLLYAEASRGAYEEGAIAAMLIVLVGLLPVILLARSQRNSYSAY
ncbi:ABC transporter permease [Thorsellia anophelis]|uniref:Iron(III) transport system permease protein n=1 Tax=Thorsellia anophelis DSM 18579 TaxID=1123402 RepID=A0A1I0BL55_9GAMM|nr:iron ABC transporter permease [Thorsellia anophelis]SET07388.1 iron(III) transport system permease protein [Thorsellia anophelis DSM 18579]